jgi:hypothetical protein
MTLTIKATILGSSDTKYMQIRSTQIIRHCKCLFLFYVFTYPHQIPMLYPHVIKIQNFSRYKTTA